MKEKFYLLTDYKGIFESKYTAKPYRSGLNKDLLTKYFNENNIDTVFINGSDININLHDLVNNVLLYTSQEDNELYYKSFIDDFVLAAEMNGVMVIPKYKYLHSHENKVFQELVNSYSLDSNSIPKSQCFGSIVEFKRYSQNISYPAILKSYCGSGSKKVFLVNSKSQAIRHIKKMTLSDNLGYRFKEIIRLLIHKGYIRESPYRKKFLIQEFISDLKFDWKVLVFGEKYFVLKRGVRSGDFKASGQGLLSYPSEIPKSLLCFASVIFQKHDVPFASFDIADKNGAYFLLESQFVYFGTYTAEFSPFYYCLNRGDWEKFNNPPEAEKLYVDSIITYLKRSNKTHI